MDFYLLSTDYTYISIIDYKGYKLKHRKPVEWDTWVNPRQAQWSYHTFESVTGAVKQPHKIRIQIHKFIKNHPTCLPNVNPKCVIQQWWTMLYCDVGHIWPPRKTLVLDYKWNLWSLQWCYQCTISRSSQVQSKTARITPLPPKDHK